MSIAIVEIWTSLEGDSQRNANLKFECGECGWTTVATFSESALVGVLTAKTERPPSVKCRNRNCPFSFKLGLYVRPFVDE